MKITRLVGASALALALGAGVAGAEEPGEAAAELRRDVQLLAHIDGLPTAAGSSSWLGLRPYVQRLRLDGSTGLSYTRRLPGEHHDLELEIGGPALDNIDTFGLTVELRF